MINLFETFNDASQKLQHSLYLADYRHPTVVMDDNGFLPDDVISCLLYTSPSPRD